MHKNFLLPFIPAIIGVLTVFWWMSTHTKTSETIYVQETTTESGITCVIATKGDNISLVCDFGHE